MRKLIGIALASAALVAAPTVANAHGRYYGGYGYSYGYPSYGYSSYGYGYPSYGYSYPSYGYNYGYSPYSYGGYYGSPYRSYGYGNGNAVGAAIVGGVVGLAIGSALNNNHHHHRRYYRHWLARRASLNGWKGRDTFAALRRSSLTAF